MSKEIAETWENLRKKFPTVLGNKVPWDVITQKDWEGAIDKQRIREAVEKRIQSNILSVRFNKEWKKKAKLKGDEIAAELNQFQINEAHARKREWKKFAEELGL